MQQASKPPRLARNGTNFETKCGCVPLIYGKPLVSRGQPLFLRHGAYRLEIISAYSEKGSGPSLKYGGPGGRDMRYVLCDMRYVTCAM